MNLHSLFILIIIVYIMFTLFVFSYKFIIIIL